MVLFVFVAGILFILPGPVYYLRSNITEQQETASFRLIGLKMLKGICHLQPQCLSSFPVAPVAPLPPAVVT